MKKPTKAQRHLLESLSGDGVRLTMHAGRFYVMCPTETFSIGWPAHKGTARSLLRVGWIDFVPVAPNIQESDFGITESGRKAIEVSK